MKIKENAIRRKVIGFKFEDQKYNELTYNSLMDEYIGKVGKVSGYNEWLNNYSVCFEGHYWSYPAELVEEQWRLSEEILSSMVKEDEDSGLYEEGMVITAVYPCKMNSDGREVLTVGKDYTIIHVDLEDGEFTIMDDGGYRHDFKMKDFRSFFKQKEESSILEEVNSNFTPAEEDFVNSPSHYSHGDIECIDAIKASLSPEGYRGFLKANCIKYLWRYESKFNPLEDLKKCEYYLKKLIEAVENE